MQHSASGQIDATAAKEQTELYSLLISLKSERLLVPRTCVAEVVAFVDPERDRDNGGPNWLLGSIDWNGRQLPIVSFDVANAGERRGRRSRARVVVFHALTDVLPVGFYGLLTHGFPQLIRVNPDVLALDRDQAIPPGLPVLCRVRMIHEYPLIPDLEALERMIAGALLRP